MNKAPVSVQQWLETIPQSQESNNNVQGTTGSSTNPSNKTISNSKPSLRLLGRETSTQSDNCSHCSSVESVLEFRKADPEAVLLGLGFGPSHSTQCTRRIPRRFLQPSQLLTNIDINKFLQEQGELECLEQ